MHTATHRVCLALLAMTLAGCTTQSLYTALQETAKQRCLRFPPTERAECEAKLNKDDYDIYSKTRATE